MTASKDSALVSAWVPDAVAARLGEVARERGQSKSAVIRDALDRELS